MHGEVPQFKRCCCCIPLRRGLIGYGYLKVALSILNGAYFIWIFYLLVFLFGIREMYFLLLIFAVLLIDLAFNVLLIVAGHTKSPRLMRASYICGIVWLCIVMIISTGIIWTSVRRMVNYWEFEHIPHENLIMDLIIGLTLMFITTCVQGYVILLIRSEMIKLQSQSLEMQFTNHAADDGEARCVRAGKQDDVPKCSEITVVDA